MAIETHISASSHWPQDCPVPGIEVKPCCWPGMKNDGSFFAMVISLQSTHTNSVWWVSHLSLCLLLCFSRSYKPPVTCRWKLGLSKSVSTRSTPTVHLHLLHMLIRRTLHLLGTGSTRDISLMDVWKDWCPNMIRALILFCLMARKRTDLNTWE